MPEGQLTTVGEVVVVHSDSARPFAMIEGAAGGRMALPDQSRPSVVLHIQQTHAAFSTAGMRTVTRGACSDGQRTVISNACGSGYDLQFTIDDDVLAVAARYRPSTATRAANLVLGARFALLSGQVLLHYPSLWRAGWRGRVPLHAAVFSSAGRVPLVAGPGGVGKSSLISRAALSGAATTADNLCAGDGYDCYGLSEPLRLDSPPVGGAGSGVLGAGRPISADRRAGIAGSSSQTSHGRSVAVLPGRVPSLTPDRVIVLERAPASECAQAGVAEATRALVAGTYAAGELRRYWQLAATLALATGIGPAHPAIETVARCYAERLPCLRVLAGDGDLPDIDDIYGAQDE